MRRVLSNRDVDSHKTTPFYYQAYQKTINNFNFNVRFSIHAINKASTRLLQNLNIIIKIYL